MDDQYEYTKQKYTWKTKREIVKVGISFDWPQMVLKNIQLLSWVRSKNTDHHWIYRPYATKKSKNEEYAR